MNAQLFYKYDEVRDILDTVKNEDTETAFQKLSQKMGRTKGGLRMVVSLDRRFLQNPNAVKKVSQNMANILAKYHAQGGEQAAPQKPSASALSVKLDETFALMQRTMSQYIDAVVEERTAEMRAKSESDVQQNAQELSELRAFKRRAQELLG
jgi:hypothetical protein